MNSRIASDLPLAAIAVVAVAATSVLGQLATYPNLEPWFASLAKPSFNPPNWVFAPVWTTLYAMMAFAFWRILRLPDSQSKRSTVLLFTLMLALNAAWSWMFFAAHSPLFGLVNILPQLALIAVVIGAVWRLDKIAGLVLLPLAAWVAFATLLNFSIWRLNA